MINTSKADMNMYNEVINRVDPALKIYNELRREADEARKAMELTQANLMKAMKIAKELNKAMWDHHHNQGASDRLHKLRQKLKGYK